MKDDANDFGDKMDALVKRTIKEALAISKEHDFSKTATMKLGEMLGDKITAGITLILLSGFVKETLGEDALGTMLDLNNKDEKEEKKTWLN